MERNIENSSKYRIEAVTEANYAETLNYINSIFQVDSTHIVPGGIPVTEASLKASLDPESQTAYLEHAGIKKLEYFILRNQDNEIVGSIGYYTCPKDEAEAAYVGWFSVDPKARNQGTGKALLSELESLAKIRGKKYLRLYTSDDPNEAAAQILYEKAGLIETGRQKDQDYPYTYIFREKKLEPSPTTTPEKVNIFQNRISDIANDTSQDAKQALQSINPEKDPRKITIKEVTTPQAMAEWLPVFKEIFTDPTDREPDENFYEKLNDPNSTKFYMFMEGDKIVGIQEMSFSKRTRSMYIPYTGLIPEYRNLNILPKIHDLLEREMKLRGIKATFIDVEDPSRLEALCKGYPDEDPETVRQRALGRINFWRRTEYLLIDDPAVPYMRPASDDPEKEIQAYDVMMIRPANFNDKIWESAFNNDRTAITKAAYKGFYLEMMQIQYGNLSENELRAKYPAIDQFFSNLENYPGKWIKVETSAIRPNQRKSANVELKLAA